VSARLLIEAGCAGVCVHVAPHHVEADGVTQHHVEACCVAPHHVEAGHSHCGWLQCPPVSKRS